MAAVAITFNKIQKFTSARYSTMFLFCERIY